jgi:hypothetical protein
MVVAAATGRGRPIVPQPQEGDTVPPTFEPAPASVTRQDQEVVELPLLLPRWQALELEALARERGMTTGQMLRRMVREALADQQYVVQS